VSEVSRSVILPRLRVGLVCLKLSNTSPKRKRGKPLEYGLAVETRQKRRHFKAYASHLGENMKFGDRRRGWKNSGKLGDPIGPLARSMIGLDT